MAQQQLRKGHLPPYPYPPAAHKLFPVIGLAWGRRMVLADVVVRLFVELYFAGEEVEEVEEVAFFGEPAQ